MSTISGNELFRRRFIFFNTSLIYLFFFLIVVVISLHRKSTHNLQHIDATPFSWLPSDMLLNFSLFLTFVLLEDLHNESIME